MKVRIDIDTRTFVRFWLVVIGFIFAILAIYRAREALLIIGIAFFLALALNGPVSWIARHLPGRSRAAGTSIAYVLVIAVLAAFLFLVVPPIIDQTVHFAKTVPALVDNATTQWHGVNHLISKYHLQSQVNDAIISIKQSTGHITANLGSKVVGGVGSALVGLTSTVIVLVLTFLMLVEGPDWTHRLWGVYNDEIRMKHHREIAEKMYQVVSGYVTGQLAVSAIGGFLAGAAVFV
ncbi:MAG TPA: AI-2E family transporter, partial [Candidatus Saccharimonadaceae bacterium]|nr:AI-2E family transporter [Candidatus Saccharimonadaceae bacterium]